MRATALWTVILLAMSTGCPVAAGNSVVAIPAPVQHFGPLVVVAMDTAVDEPESLRKQLFSESAAERIKLLRTLGVESVPDLQMLWSAFLKDHSGESPARVVSQFVSGSILDANISSAGSHELILSIGFDETTEKPLELRGVLEEARGQWKLVATVACRCRMFDDTQPWRQKPSSPMPRQEWVISTEARENIGYAFHRQEIRFRIRGGLLWPLIEFESMAIQCPDEELLSPACEVIESQLQPAALISENGSQHSQSGFVLITHRGHPPATPKAVMLLRDPSCRAYVWNEDAYAYLPSLLAPESCGTASGKDADQVLNRR